ncbi:DUF2207 domain-containing protein [bacterium]|nr:MAG: DUF2207 domain-containing protein [bacterium]
MQKKMKFLKLTFTIFLSAIFIFPFTALAQGQDSSALDAIYTEEVNNLEVTIITDSEGIYVKERIEYDFGSQERHGIFRNIPYKYKNNLGKFNLRIEDITVKRNGENEPVSISRSGGEVKLKIGDSEKTITGKHVYDIAYSVKRAINFFADHDELYWNAIGTGWTAPIVRSSVLIVSPAQITKVQCFTGSLNSQESNCTKTGENTTQPQLTNNEVLYPGEGFTVVIAFPVGAFAKPTAPQKIMDIVRDNGVVVLPILVFIIMFWLWRKFGKDAKGRGVIVPQYDPPQNLTPLYMGTLVDGRLDNRDFAAELIYLATHGYIKIERIETKKFLWLKGKNYEFTKLKEAGSSLPESTRSLFSSIFANETTKNKVLVSELRDNALFSSYVRSAPNDVFKELKTAGYYKYNPVLLKGIFIALGFGFAMFSTFVLMATFGLLGLFSGIASGIIIIVFGFLMPARTVKGAEEREYILGLKHYMNVAEKDRLEFHNAPEKNPERFELLLPFAVALGVEKRWAKQFEGIYTSQPSWYSDSTGAGFNAAVLSSSIGDFSSSMQSAVSSVTTSASGGSGFSGGGVGGGGGGGGGGSW